jgi:DNA repair protein RadD
MNKSGLVADIVEMYLKYGEGRKAVVFCVGAGHSPIRDRFIEAGIKPEHIDGDTPKEERDATRDRLKAPR